MIDPTPVFRRYARWRTRRIAALDPVASQAETLANLVATARDTAFGRAHGFDRVDSVAAFQNRVPLRTYEDFWNDWFKATFPVLDDVAWPGRIPHFAVTSGTTSGRTKYIPVTRPMLDANEQAALQALLWHLVTRPDSVPLAGRLLMLGGSTDLEDLGEGITGGDLSALATIHQPPWSRLLTLPHREGALIDDWDRKLAYLAELCREHRITGLSGTPSWMLILLDRIRENLGIETGPTLPDLDLVVHGGVAWPPYRRAFARHIPDLDRKTREVYPASEGFIAVADGEPGEGMRLVLDNGLFFEFVPTAELGAHHPTRHWVDTVQTGVDYAVVVTTNAGLWAYVLGDTVRFVERDPPRVLVTGRTSWMLSAFGEHLIDEEIEAAVTVAAEAEDLALADFTVGPLYPREGRSLGRHLFIIEVEDAGREEGARRELEERLAKRIDDDLADRNDDYRAHRGGDTGMASPMVRLVPSGSFARWMQSRGQAGGQNKVPRVLTDDDRLGALVEALNLQLDL